MPEIRNEQETNIMNEMAAPRFSIGQRVRYTRSPRSTGRVTGTWQHHGDEFHPAQPGVLITMDNQYSPPPTPVRFQTFGHDFESLPDDYLDDTEAMEAIQQAASNAVGAADLAARVLDILRRNERISEDPS